MPEAGVGLWRWNARVVGLALPLILTNLSQPIVATVGTVIAGHLPDAAYLGGVALGGVFFNFLFWSLSFLRKGTAGFAAQAYGAGDREGLGALFWRALLLSLAIGLAVTCATPLLTAYGLPLMGGSSDVLAVAQLYCGIRLAAMPIALANAVNLGFLLGCQRTGWTLNTQIAANLAHIGLAYGLAVALGLGVVGLAVAAVLADIVSLALTLLLAARQRIGRPHPRRIFAPAAIRRLLLANLDLFVRSTLMMIGLGWFTSAGAALGDRFLAANALLLVFQNYLAFVVDGFSNAAQTLIGSAYGVRDARVVRDTVAVAGFWASVLGLVASAIFALFGAQLIAMMTNQEIVRAAATAHLHWMIIAPPIMAWAFLLDGLFLGALRTRELRNAMIATLVAYSAAILALPGAFGNDGLWAAYLILMGGRVLTLGVQWWRGAPRF